ncbi:MAG TPA: hypothetical protein VKS60_01215 [Stellaceae bacterium]|nr:hypothetical protein [Stellaceae bacterium]
MATNPGQAPQLDEAAKLVLQIILDNTIVRGANIMSLASISDPKVLLKAAKELAGQKLIEVNGELTEERVPLATFSTLPSRKFYLRELT